MTRGVTASTRDTLHTVSRLDQMGTLDPLFRDMYLQRARELFAPVLSQASYEDLKTKTGELSWTEQQLRVAVERAEWERACQLLERLRELRTRISSAGQSMKLGEILYERTPVSIDPFATSLAVFTGSSSKSLTDSRNEALQLLESLKRSDPRKASFYNQRRADFSALAIADAGTLAKKESRVQPRHAALDALNDGDLARLGEVLDNLIAQAKVTQIDSATTAVELSDAKGPCDDLLFEFTPETLAAARKLGLNPARTRSRRHLARLLPHGWQPSFRKAEAKREQLSRLTFPNGPSDRTRDAIEYFLLNPFVTSAGTRYRVCLVAEDLLLEDFAEPEVNEEMSSELLSELGLSTRWGLTRLEIEDALLEHGPRIVEELHLDPEAFRLGLIPPDIFTHLACNFGWGQKENWTHFDGYRVLDGDSLQALAGGDARFGGTHDVISVGLNYANPRILARFAVMQRRRMMDWHRH